MEEAEEEEALYDASAEFEFSQLQASTLSAEEEDRCKHLDEIM